MLPGSAGHDSVTCFHSHPREQKRELRRMKKSEEKKERESWESPHPLQMPLKWASELNKKAFLSLKKFD